MSSNIRLIKICDYCKNEFVAKTTVTQCCSDNCAKRLYKLKQNEQKVAQAELKTEIQRKPKAFMTAGIVLSLLFPQLSRAQFSGFSLNKATKLLNMQRIAVFDSMKKQGFIYGGEDGGFDVFTKKESMGEARLVLSFTNNRLRIISWTESLIYARYMLNDIDNSDFVLIEQRGIFSRYKDENRGLILNLFNQSKQGYMTINLTKPIIKEIPTQKPTANESKNNKPKAVFQAAAS